MDLMVNSCMWSALCDGMCICTSVVRISGIVFIGAYLVVWVGFRNRTQTFLKFHFTSSILFARAFTNVCLI